MVQLRCPQCSTTFAAQPGAPTRCPKCRYDGGPAPGGPTRRNAATTGVPIAPPPPLVAPTPLGPPAPGPYARPQPTNGLCVAALVCGILGLCSVITIVPSVLALVFGVVGRSQARVRQHAGEGMAIAGIVLGSVGIVIGLLYWALVASILGSL